MPSPNKANDSEKNKHISNGPHKSQFFNASILVYLCFGNNKIT